MKVKYIRVIGFILIFLILVLPVVLITYYLQLRLLLLVPIVIYEGLFYSGVLVQEGKEVTFEFEDPDQ